MMIPFGKKTDLTDQQYRIGVFETDPNQTDTEVACVDWTTMSANYMLFKLYDGQSVDNTATATATGTFEAQDVSAQPVTYLCHEGRALAC